MSLNKLHSEKSAYLLQHANNPIHWWSYGPQALEEAKKLNRPIFLSIGYSSCHWCHVMAHESFEDQAIGNYLNEHFVSIKVDREEHPDVDHLYQTVAAAATGRGGWPLSVFLTPDLLPIFVGTYFPKEGRQGMPGFHEVLKHIQNLYQNDRAKITEQGQHLLQEIAKPATLERDVKFDGHYPSPAAIMNALQNYADKANGGYGEAPKFPHFPFLEWASEQILEGMIPKELGQHIVDTVEKMVMGGMYDHLKGGVHRYSVDTGWVVPHFEKMLYDQAGFLKVLSKMTAFYPSPLLFDAIVQTLDYLNTEMVSESGHFMCSQDADSEGHEGLYFTFSREEFVNTLKENEDEVGAYDPAWEEWFRISETGNFENGLNVISLNPALKEGIYAEENWAKVRKIRHTLLQERKQRIPPATDSKGVASWNFALVSALCDVIQYCRVGGIAQQAINLLDRVNEGVSQSFLDKDAQGRHVFRHTTTTKNAPLYFEDYVAFADSQLRMHEVMGAEVFLNNAIETVRFLKREFFFEGTPMLVAGSQKGEMRAPLNDQAFRSPLGTLMLTTARLSLLAPEFHPMEFWGTKWQQWVQFSLVNPLGHAEALRAYTYPLDIIRKIEVPLGWINEGEFQQLRSHFLGRFVLTYHARPTQEWQVCNRSTCEKQGHGMASLLETFAPAEEGSAQ